MREMIPDAVAEGIFMAGSGQPRGTQSNVLQLSGVLFMLISSVTPLPSFGFEYLFHFNYNNQEQVSIEYAFSSPVLISKHTLRFQ